MYRVETIDIPETQSEGGGRLVAAGRRIVKVLEVKDSHGAGMLLRVLTEGEDHEEEATPPVPAPRRAAR